MGIKTSKGCTVMDGPCKLGDCRPVTDPDPILSPAMLILGRRAESARRTYRMYVYQPSDRRIVALFEGQPPRVHQRNRGVSALRLGAERKQRPENGKSVEDDGI